MHDFTAEQFKDMSLQLYPFLKIKTAFQEMEGILDNCVDNEYFLQYESGSRFQSTSSQISFSPDDDGISFRCQEISEQDEDIFDS